MDPQKIIRKYYDPNSEAYRVLVTHSELVMQKALALAQRVAHLQPNLHFIREAAMLHDIGMIFTNAPKIGCHGEHPYIMHGILGRELLETEGFPKHAHRRRFEDHGRRLPRSRDDGEGWCDTRRRHGTRACGDD